VPCESVPCEPVPCEQVSGHLAEVAEGRVFLGGDERRHVEHCLRCQAEVAQYRRLLRGLRAMRTERIDPPDGLLADILAGVEQAAGQRAVVAALRGKRAAYVGGFAAAATAAAAGGAIVLASRSRRRIRLAS
jgi:hypothetical protein